MKKIFRLFAAAGLVVASLSMGACSDEETPSNGNNSNSGEENDIIPNNGVGEDGKIHLTKSFGGIYFGDFWDLGIGDYYIMLTNDEVGMTGNGDPAPMHQGGWILYLDFWGDLSEDHTNPILPEGVYTYANDRGPNVLTAGYTLATNNVERVEQDGEYLYRIVDVLFVGGTTTVTHTEKGYRIEAELFNVAEQPIQFVYEGEIVFEDESDDEDFSTSIDWDVAMEPVRVNTYRSSSDPAYDNHVLRLFDVETITEDGVHPGEPGMKLQLDLFTEPGAKNLAGTYRPGVLNDKGILEKVPGVFYPGQYWSTMALGSFLEYVADDYSTVLYSVLQDGELTITENQDGTFTIVGDFTSETGNKVTCNWTGEIEQYRLE
uniref:hypothetical protein n=1 Tax=Alistipes sp. TaxID=1872444 RepID=UPI0040566B17